MPEPGRRGSLFVIFLTVFIDLLGFGLVMPLIPLYAENLTAFGEMSTSQRGLTIGALMSCFSAMQFLFAPFWGRLSDRIGRRPVLMVGLAGSTISYFLFGVATQRGSLTWMFLTRIGAGIAGATIPTAQAYIADCTTAKGRSKGMALIGAAFGLGFMFGPLIGAAALWLSPDQALSPWPGFVASAISGVALVVAYFRLPESLSPGVAASTSARRLFDAQALRSALATPSVAALILCTFLAVTAFSNFESTVARLTNFMLGRAEAGEMARHVNPEVLLVFAYIGLMQTLAQGLIVRRLAGKIKDETMAQLGAGVSVLGIALIAMAGGQGQVSLLLGALTVTVLGFAMLNPSLNALVSRRTDPARQGGILGLNQSASALARIAGPVVGNFVYDRRGHTWPYWTASAMMLFAAVVLAAAARTGRDFPAEPATTRPKAE